MAVTDDNVKTRSQKDKLDQIVSSSDDQEEDQHENNGEEGNGEHDDEDRDDGDEGKVETTTDDSKPESPVAPPKLVRDGTMAVTAKVGRGGYVCVCCFMGSR